MKILTLQVGSIGTNCYIVCDETEHMCAVVDPGGDAPAVAEAVRSSGCVLSCILLTHGHYDHTGGVAELQREFPGVPVYLSDHDRYPEEDAAARQLFPPLEGDVRNYDEGDTVSVGALKLSVLATPGHSKGSVTLEAEDVLLCGDTLFAGSCGRTDFLGGDVQEIMASLRRLGSLEGSRTVLPGHMDASDLDSERARNPYLRHALRG